MEYFGTTFPTQQALKVINVPVLTNAILGVGPI